MNLIRPYISINEISTALSNAIMNRTLIDKDDTSIIFYDLNFIFDRVINLKHLFPKTALHAIATKANPLIGILKNINELNVGSEVASFPELYLAERAGFSCDKIVFDSPVKTRDELEYALIKGIHINVDSFEEIDRIAELLLSIKSTSTVGVRVNPQVGPGRIKSTSVADSISKFGIPLNENHELLTDYYEKFSWLTGIHVHIGSQGCPVDLMVEGVRKVLDFTNILNSGFQNKQLKNRINIFDIGGGLPVSYYSDIKPPSMEEYKNKLTENFPELFGPEFKLITEFGRYIHANAGWVASRVEYVKHEIDYNIIMTHIGADLLLRKCYNPDDWNHQISVLDRKGNIKIDKVKTKYIVAGPLCFAGDVIGTDIELPKVDPGDFIIIHDTGAYTLSMWSRYNSRQIPKVIVYDNNSFDFKIIKRREKKESLYDFWS